MRPGPGVPVASRPNPRLRGRLLEAHHAEVPQAQDRARPARRAELGWWFAFAAILAAGWGIIDGWWW